MRRALIAIVVASGLFAVGAFAATFGVNTDNVASGEGTVGSCAELAEVEFVTNPGITNLGGDTTDWTVDSVKIFFSNSAAKTPACNGADASLAIGNSADGTAPAESWIDVGSCGVVGSDGIVTCDVDPGVPVRPIVEVAVLANGDAIPGDIGPSVGQ